MRVIIEHKDGKQYSVEPSAFHKLYEQDGYKIVRNEDGTPYEAPTPKAAKADKAAEDKPATPDKGA